MTLRARRILFYLYLNLNLTTTPWPQGPQEATLSNNRPPTLPTMRRNSKTGFNSKT